MRCRAARAADLAFCRANDRGVRPSYVARKVAAGECFVCEAEGSLAGYLRLELLWGLTPHIGIVNVDSSARVRGVGRALVDHVRKLLKKRRERFLFSSAAAADRGARAWHEKVGFRKCGEIRGVLDGEAPEIFYRLRT